MYSVKTIEYLTLKQENDFDIEYYHFWGLFALFFLQIKSVTKWSHTLALINKTKFLNDADFIIRLLYKHAYWFL